MARRKSLKLSESLPKNAYTLEVGPKNRPLPMPNTHYRVANGEVKEGDMFANVGNPNKPSWQTVEPEDIGQSVEGYEAIIRKAIYGTCT
jgi:hypothetical protein